MEEAEELHERTRQAKKTGTPRTAKSKQREEKTRIGTRHRPSGWTRRWNWPVTVVKRRPFRQPLLGKHEGQHGDQDHHGQRGGRVVAGHPGDEEVVDRRAEDEEAEGETQHLLDLEGLQRDHGAEGENTDRMAGIMTGTVILSAVRSPPAPATREASSKEAFMLRKAGVSRMTLTVSDPVRTCTQTMPQNE